MGFLKKLFGREQKAPPTEPERPEMITAFDQFGREIQVSRDTWRRDVLPANLQKHWSDPDELSSLIIMALDDGFATDLLAAAKRLYETDPNRERGACLHAIVLMKSRKLAEAERVIVKALAESPQSAALLTNLAKVQADKGDEQKSRATLWQAILADPNFADAVNWYGALEEERNGKGGWIAAMRRIAALDGSWRANLWLARELLEAKDLAGARALYEKVLIMAAGEPEVLLQISGDLGRAGHLDEIISLVLPFYDHQRHDIGAGFNLLQAFLELGDWQRGEELLHKLMLLGLPPYREQMMWYSGKFAELKQQPSTPQAIGEISIEIVRLDQPVWTSGLASPSWLLPSPSESGREIAILAFSNTSPLEPGLLRENEALVGHEDDVGRLTRAIPLHLSDTLRFQTDARPAVFLPVVVGGGMMVSGAEPDAEGVERMTGGAAVAIAGTVAIRDEQIHIEMIGWKKGDTRPFGRIDEHGPMAELPAVYDACQATLLALLQHEGYLTPKPSPAHTIPPQLFRPYLDGLGQTYAIALSALDLSPDLYGERNIHRWILRLALDMPDLPKAKIALLSVLANGRRRGSAVYREIEKETIALFAGVPKGSDLDRLTPMLFRLFDRIEEFESRRNELLRGASDDYVRWLGEIETTFSEPAAPR